MKFPYTTSILGALLMLFSGVALFVPAFLAYFMKETEFIYNFGLTGFITFIIGCFLFFLSSEKDGDLRTKDGFIITIYFWTVLGFFGSVPFFLADLEGVSYIDSLFESISGLTTTGATVLVGLDEITPIENNLENDFLPTDGQFDTTPTNDSFVWIIGGGIAIIIGAIIVKKFLKK